MSGVFFRGQSAGGRVLELHALGDGEALRVFALLDGERREVVKCEVVNDIDSSPRAEVWFDDGSRVYASQEAL